MITAMVAKKLHEKGYLTSLYNNYDLVHEYRFTRVDKCARAPLLRPLEINNAYCSVRLVNCV